MSIPLEDFYPIANPTNKMRWISVEDEMPPVDSKYQKNQYVYVFVAIEGWAISCPMIYAKDALRSGTVKRWKWPNGTIYNGNRITHWMKSPAPPKPDNRNEEETEDSDA